MGRSPCCEKIGIKKGPWTPEEDQKLLAYVEEHGHGSWRALPAKAGLQRCGKSCRLRWTNYLRPDIKRGKFSLQEEQSIIQLHALLGNRWSAIATHLPKRTDNEIKNYWNSHLKKRLAKMGIDPVTHKPHKEALLSCEGQSKNTANLNHMAQWESARLEAEARLVRQSKLRSASSRSLQTSQLGPRTGSIQKPTSPALFLDVGIASTFSTITGNDSESVPEVPSPAVGIGVGDGQILKDVTEEWKMLPKFSDGSGNPSMITSEWLSGSAGMNPTERVSFDKRVTDLLLSTTSMNHHTKNSFGEETDDGTISNGDCCDDNKNYWNNILNLVDSPPSPML